MHLSFWTKKELSDFNNFLAFSC